MSPRWLVLAMALVFGACSLTSSLDDLKGADDAGLDASSGGKDSGTGGSGGSGGAGATGGTGGTGWVGGGGAGGTGGNGGTGGSAVDPCTGEPDCNACCQTSHSEGAKAFVAAIQACVCTGSSSCAQVCAAFCNNGQIDQSCGTCVATPSVQECLANECTSADCQTYLSCNGSC